MKYKLLIYNDMDIRFTDAVKRKDLVKVRFFLSNELMLDPRGITFNEMRHFAESHLPELYEEHDGEEYVTYITDKSQWDSNYLYRVKNALDFNFSRERLDYYEQVVKVVLKEKADNLDKEEKQHEEEQITAQTETEEEMRQRNKRIHIGILAGGTVVAITGLCLSKVAIASLGAAGILIGGYLLYKENGR